MVGLWLGERGRRQAAERVLVTGSPTEIAAKRLPDQDDAAARAMTAGRVMASAQLSEDTIKRGVAHLQREAEAVGQSLSAEEARKQVLAMVAGAVDEEPDLPGFS